MRVERVKYDEKLFKNIIPTEVEDTVDENDGVLYCLFDGENCIGIALYKLLQNDEMVQLVYLYIAEELRGNGYGSMLLNDTCKLVVESGKKGVLIKYVGTELEVDGISEFWMQNSFYQVVETHAQFIYKFENLKYEKLFNYDKEVFGKQFYNIRIKDVRDLKCLARENSRVDLSSILNFDLDYNLSEFYEENGDFIGGLLVSKKGSVVQILDAVFNDTSELKRIQVFVGGIRKIYERCLNDYDDISEFVICNIPYSIIKKARMYLGYPYKEYY